MLVSEDGKFSRLLESGSIKTNAQKYQLWSSITTEFNIQTGADYSHETTRLMYNRMKQTIKKKHDVSIIEKQDREFKKACALTGGGPGPAPLPAYDGDAPVNLSSTNLLLDPAATPFNTLAKKKRIKNPMEVSLDERTDQTQSMGESSGLQYEYVDLNPSYALPFDGQVIEEESFPGF